METAGTPKTDHMEEIKGQSLTKTGQPQECDTSSTSHPPTERESAAGLESFSFDPRILPGGSLAAEKGPPSKTPPKSPQHSLSPTVPISIARPQLHSHPEGAVSPPHPPLMPLNRTPPQEGVLSAAAGLVAGLSSEGERLSRRDCLSHSPSPSRRRPPLSPSSSSGGMTPPKMAGAPNPKPVQKGFYNPYGVKNPYRVTGFVPGSPKALMPVATLSAETENELLHATERGLFSEEGGNASENVAQEKVVSASGGKGNEKGLAEGATVSSWEAGEGAASSSREVADETHQGLEELAAAEIEQERKRRRSEESLEKDAEAGASSMEPIPEPRLTPVSLLPSSDAGVNWPCDGDASGSSGAGVNQPFHGGANWPSDNNANRPGSDSCGDRPSSSDRVKRSFTTVVTGPSDGREKRPSDGGVNRSPEKRANRPSSDGCGNRPSSDGSENRPSARDRWRRARLHVTAARAFSYGGLGGFSEIEIDGSSSGKRQKAPTATAASVDAPSADSVTQTASSDQPTPGASTSNASQDRGRRRFEGIEVLEERHWATVLSDLYIRILKAPLLEFLFVIFLFPGLLCLVFAPLYLLDVHGLQCNDCKPPLPSPTQNQPPETHSICHVLLYSLSLSMLFGGSPVQAHSRYTLLVANLQTLAAQFTFVFLSGAVFSRMSQRSQPVKSACKAVIRQDDVTGEEGDVSERHRVFTTRLVLKGPEPAVLVDVRIQLTFRVFLQQRNGSVFCTTSALDLVRPEVAYLQYGIAVKHVIDSSSPLFGHTHDSLLAGDASFSLTILGTERSSLESIFHMQEYFLSDGDVIWDGDFVSFLSVDANGGRVIDHSQLDAVKGFRRSVHVPRAIMRMQNLVRTMTRGGTKRPRGSKAAKTSASNPPGTVFPPGKSVTKPPFTPGNETGEVTQEGDDVIDGKSVPSASGSGINSGANKERMGFESEVSVAGGSGQSQSIGGNESDSERKFDGSEKGVGVEGERTSTGGSSDFVKMRLADDKVNESVEIMSGPAFGGGLPREALQTLRRRKLDEEGGEESSMNSDGKSGSRRFNAGF